ncbi:hypothetical protein [Labilibacter marinus]|uniref:hypothetical protein n=1 Tax=Labilibacter marinus TaxID=1477105 RepID=UPI001179BBC3|nr:hypothetical protein [Labilibacter marinus]
MKTVFKFLVVIMIGLMSVSCDEEPIEPDNKHEECIEGKYDFYRVLAQTSINCFDNQFGSLYQNRVFTVLNIVQNQYKTCRDGREQIVTEDIIKFRNVTAHNVTFDFSISQNVNGNFKQYQGHVSGLKGGEVYEINTGENTFYNVSMGPIMIQGNSIIYN